MQMVDMSKCIKGIFVKELKNRFLCEVIVSGISTICYVPSSCRLGNFLKLRGRMVLLVPTTSPNARTKYALFAVPYKRNYILLNTSMANWLVEDNLKNRQFSFLGKRTHFYTEHQVNGYKSDLFIEDTHTIIEVKSVLSLDSVAKFPTVYSERTLKQLEMLKGLLASGFRVHYCIISLNPYVKAIQVLSNTSFYSMLKTCLQNGMTISGHSCYVKAGGVHLKHRIPITVDNDYTNFVCGTIEKIQS